MITAQLDHGETQQVIQIPAKQCLVEETRVADELKNDGLECGRNEPRTKQTDKKTGGILLCGCWQLPQVRCLDSIEGEFPSTQNPIRKGGLIGKKGEAIARIRQATGSAIKIESGH